MSIGSLGLIGSFATSSAAQRAGDVEKVERDTADRARQTESNMAAEDAAGIGHTEQESEASDRDADGRRPWELPAHANRQEDDTASASPAHVVKDPTGQTGGTLDLLG
jgi:hypothetical protein